MFASRHDIITFNASSQVHKGIHALHVKNKLPCNTRVIEYGNKPEHSKNEGSICSYIKGEYDDVTPLRDSLVAEESNRIFFLSLQPKQCDAVGKHLASLFSKSGWNRVIVDNHLGYYNELRAMLSQYVSTNDLYFVNRFLAKPAIASIPQFRQKFAHIWNKDNIERITINGDIDQKDLHMLVATIYPSKGGSIPVTTHPSVDPSVNALDVYIGLHDGEEIWIQVQPQCFIAIDYRSFKIENVSNPYEIILPAAISGDKHVFMP